MALLSGFLGGDITPERAATVLREAVAKLADARATLAKHEATLATVAKAMRGDAAKLAAAQKTAAAKPSPRNAKVAAGAASRAAASAERHEWMQRTVEAAQRDLHAAEEQFRSAVAHARSTSLGAADPDDVLYDLDYIYLHNLVQAVRDVEENGTSLHVLLGELFGDDDLPPYAPEEEDAQRDWALGLADQRLANLAKKVRAKVAAGKLSKDALNITVGL